MNFYNDNDPKAAAWLRELIAAGLIAPGVVDERSITDLRATELAGFAQCHFFAGIGGWSHALRLAGWPDNRPVWTASCPCQPFSAAGKQMGRADPRHLWPALRRLINRARPATVFGEQVASAPGRAWLANVFSDLETMGYSPAGSDLPAAGIGSPCIRQRLWWVAYANRGLAVADGGQSGHQQLQSGGQHGQQPANGAAGGLERPEQSGLEGYTWHVSVRGESRWLDALPGGSTAAAGRACFWTGARLVDCTDGRARPIQPESFPLAFGISGRLGLIRGYGNAINAPLAAQFIQAAEAARHSLI